MFWQEENRGRNKNDEIYRSVSVENNKSKRRNKESFLVVASFVSKSFGTVSLALVIAPEEFIWFFFLIHSWIAPGLLRRSPTTMEKPVRWFNCKACATNMLDAIHRIGETRFCSFFFKCDETKNVPESSALRNLIYFEHQPRLSIIVPFNKISNKNLRKVESPI